MREYTKHKICRKRDVSKGYIEVVFERNGLQWTPGGCITLYNGPDVPVFIASGIQESWVSVILNRDLFDNFFLSTGYIKLNVGVDDMFPELLADENPIFAIDSYGVGALFSWASSNMGKQATVCYLGDDFIQPDWIADNHVVINAVELSSIKEMDGNIYLAGNRDLFDHELHTMCKYSLTI